MTRQYPWQEVLGLWVVALALLGAAGCAGSQRPAAVSASAPLPSTRAGARDELSLLERSIAGYRRRIGLPSRAGSLGKAADGTAESPVGQPAAEQPALVPLSPAPAERAPGTVDAGRDEAPDRCRYTRAICNAAERICRIAGYLDDDDARTRCSRAREDCSQARRVTQC